MPAQAKSVVFAGPHRPLELRSVELPELRPGETLVRVTHATLCGSDLHSFVGRRQVPTPTILGHEIVGRVAAMADDAVRLDLHGNTVREGDRITWGVVASCGACFYCKRDLPQKCLRAVKYGHEPLAPGMELRGGLAEFCLLAPGTPLVRLPASLSDELACPASCATATAAAACEAAGPLCERRVLVVGAGLVGLTACAMASGAGAERIVLCDSDPSRLAWAERFGATDFAAPDRLREAVAGATERHGADCVLEMSGNPSALTGALDAARVGATIVLVGSVFPQPPEPVSAERLVRQHVTLRGVHNYAPRHLAAALDFLARQPAERWTGVVGRWFELAEAEAAFRSAAVERPLRIGLRP